MALCSETRAEFYLADQGILMNGSVAAALYPSYPPEELKRTIAMADAKALFVEDPKMFAQTARRAGGASDHSADGRSARARFRWRTLRRHGRTRGGDSCRTITRSSI